MDGVDRPLTCREARALGEKLDGTRLDAAEVCEHELGFRPGPCVVGDLAIAGYGQCRKCGLWEVYSVTYLNQESMPICDECEVF